MHSDLAEQLHASRRILIVSGAGVSTASGIPDFRGPGGVWSRRRPVYYDQFLASETARIEYWDYKLETWEIYQRAQPNALHHAIVALERAGKFVAVVTQNVDGLHRRAGTSPGLLVELHGTDLLVECQSCHATSEPEPHFASSRRRSGRRLPRAAACSSRRRSASVNRCALGSGTRTPRRLTPISCWRLDRRCPSIRRLRFPSWPPGGARPTSSSIEGPRSTTVIPR